MGIYDDVLLLLLEVPEEIFKNSIDKDHILIDFLRYI